jgi:hypothetical protein
MPTPKPTSKLFDQDEIPEVPIVSVPAPSVKQATEQLTAVGAAHARKAAAKADKQKAKIAKVIATAKAKAHTHAGTVIIPGSKKAAPKKVPAPKTAQPLAKRGSLASHCSICGKPLTRETSIVQGMGDTCAGHVKKLPAGTTLGQHYASLQLKDLTPDWVGLDVLVQAANKKGVSTYRVFQCIGGDRLLDAPLAPVFKVKFYNHKRYVSKDALKSIDLMQKI